MLAPSLFCRLSIGLPILAALVSPAARAGSDFNGDGVDDLVVGDPWADVGGVVDAGQVQVLFGVTGQPIGSGTRQDCDWQTFGLATAATNERFGSSVAIGDFNGDGFDDLAIGDPNRIVKDIFGSGSVFVLAGGVSGLSGPREWNQASKDSKGRKVKDKPEIVDLGRLGEGQERFGHTLATGDFNGDGFDDLAIGVFETVSGKTNAGAVAVLYGSKKGLTAARNQLLTQDTKKMKDVAEQDDQFGAALVAGDFNGDGRDDLAIGVPQEEHNLVDGAAQIVFGGKKGLKAKKNAILFASDLGMGPSFQPDFARVLDAGDFNGDGRSELVASNQAETVNGKDGAGAVYVFTGATSGLSTAASTKFTEDTAGLPTTAAVGEFFGVALATGDLDGDLIDDLAIGNPLDIQGDIRPGAVLILRGGVSGLGTAGNQWWSQDTAGIPEAGEQYDNFGTALGIGDYDKNGRADLVVGVPGEDVDGAEDAGGINAIYGQAGGSLSSTGAQFLVQGAGNINGVVSAGEFFGLVIGD